MMAYGAVDARFGERPHENRTGRIAGLPAQDLCQRTRSYAVALREPRAVTVVYRQRGQPERCDETLFYLRAAVERAAFAQRNDRQHFEKMLRDEVIAWRQHAMDEVGDGRGGVVP